MTGRAALCDCAERDPFLGCPKPEHQAEKVGIRPPIAMALCRHLLGIVLAGLGLAVGVIAATEGSGHHYAAASYHLLVAMFLFVASREVTP